jgi:hypothetical protein
MFISFWFIFLQTLVTICLYESIISCSSLSPKSVWVNVGSGLAWPRVSATEVRSSLISLLLFLQISGHCWIDFVPSWHLYFTETIHLICSTADRTHLAPLRHLRGSLQIHFSRVALISGRKVGVRNKYYCIAKYLANDILAITSPYL